MRRQSGQGGWGLRRTLSALQHHIEGLEPRLFLSAATLESLSSEPVSREPGVSTVLSARPSQSSAAIGLSTGMIVSSSAWPTLTPLLPPVPPPPPPPAPATHFRVAAPASASPDTAFNVTVTALSATNRLADLYAGTVHFASSDQYATLPPDFTYSPDADGGIASFSITLRTPGSQTITVTDQQSLTGTATVTVAGVRYTTNTVVTGASSATIGQPVTYTIAVTSNGGPAVSVGSVSFAFDGAPAGTVALNASGQVQVVNGFISPGPHTVTATYSGAPAFFGSTGGTQTTIFNPVSHFSVSAPTTVSSESPFSFTFSAVDAGGGVVPNYQGTVHFTSNDPLAVLPADYTFVAGDNGTQGLHATLVTPGAHTITVTDTSNSSLTGTASTTVQRSSSTSLVADRVVVGTGQKITFTATVTLGPPGTPVGTVQFLDGSTPLGTVPLDASGKAQFAATFTAGSHTINAVYSGSADAPGSSASVSIGVAVPSNAPTIEPDIIPFPALVGQPLQIIGILRYPTPPVNSFPFFNGTMTFSDGATVLAVVPVDYTTDPSMPRAIFTTSALSPGNHMIRLDYSGDANDFAATVSGSLKVGLTSTTTLTSSAINALPGQPVTLTATVAGSGGRTPTGSVTFLDGTTPLTSVPLDATGTARLLVSTFSLGTHNVTASYPGDDAFFASTSDVLAQKVANPPPKVTAAAFHYDHLPQTLSFTFSGNVGASLSSAALQLRDVTQGITLLAPAPTYDASTNTATFSLGAVAIPDGHYTATLLASVVNDSVAALDGNGDGTPGDNYVFNFFALAGDVNHDASVNFGDLLILAQHYGAAGVFAEGDLNADGQINFADLLILAQNYGRSLPAVAAAAPAAASTQPATSTSPPATTDAAKLKATRLRPRGHTSSQLAAINMRF